MLTSAYYPAYEDDGNTSIHITVPFLFKHIFQLINRNHDGGLADGKQFSLSFLIENKISNCSVFLSQREVSVADELISARGVSRPLS